MNQTHLERQGNVADRREKAYKDFCLLVKARMNKEVLPLIPTTTQKALFTKFDCVVTPAMEDFFFVETDVDELAKKLRAVA